MNFGIATKAEAAVNTFEEFYNSFSAKLSTKLTLTKSTRNDSSSRQINQTETSSEQNELNNNNPSGRAAIRGGRGSGRFGGRGRGSYRGRGGRGRGRFGGRFRHSPTGQAKGWRPQLREYSNDEWSELSYEQRQRVHDLRNAASNINGYRRISNVNGDESTLPSQVELPPTTPNDGPPVPPSSRRSVHGRGSRAGDAFSRGSRSNNNGN